MELYPLKSNPVYSYRIWGGNKLKTVLNKNHNQESIGESWGISDIEDNETHVSEGDFLGKTLKDLISQFKCDFVGSSVFKTFGNNFPGGFAQDMFPSAGFVTPDNQLVGVLYAQLQKMIM